MTRSWVSNVRLSRGHSNCPERSKIQAKLCEVCCKLRDCSQRLSPILFWRLLILIGQGRGRRHAVSATASLRPSGLSSRSTSSSRSCYHYVLFTNATATPSPHLQFNFNFKKTNKLGAQPQRKSKAGGLGVLSSTLSVSYRIRIFGKIKIHKTTQGQAEGRGTWCRCQASYLFHFFTMQLESRL